MTDSTELSTTDEPTAAPGRRSMRQAARHLAHPVTHVAGLLTAHVIALAVLEKTPLLALLSMH